MILNDYQIKRLAEDYNMITPYCKNLIKNENDKPVISYGQSSYGYDIRISDKFKLFVKESVLVVDPKDFNTNNIIDMYPNSEGYVLMPPHSFMLGHSVETIYMPDNLLALCIGKSSYARCGVIINVTPIEPGWKGEITIEIHNTTPQMAKIYANEGIAQLIFFRGDACNTTYKDRNGKYMNQVGVTLPKV